MPFLRDEAVLLEFDVKIPFVDEAGTRFDVRLSRECLEALHGGSLETGEQLVAAALESLDGRIAGIVARKIADPQKFPGNPIYVVQGDLAEPDPTRPSPKPKLKPKGGDN